MAIQIIKASDQKTTNWSGGTTTELYISPETSSYEARDFDFRMSTATVEVASSVFTNLSGVTRTLMVLDGEMTLTHEGQHEKHLKPLESDHFNGGWVTRSEGECVDFNLMMRNNCAGILKGISLEGGEQSVIDLRNSSKAFIYLFQGDLSLETQGEVFSISDGDSFLMTELDISIKLMANKGCTAVLVFIA